LTVPRRLVRTSASFDERTLYVYTWPTSTASNVEKKKEATVAAVIDKLR